MDGGRRGGAGRFDVNEGYRFVPLPGEVRRERQDHAVHDRRIAGTFSGTIELTFRAEQPVHVGSGFKALRGKGIVRRAATVCGAPVVPGSSLKGVLRSRYEAITKSCAGQLPGDGRTRSQSHPDVQQAVFTSKVRRNPAFEDECTVAKACPACALFGLMSKRSRISVSDFMADEDLTIASIPAQFGPKAQHLGKCTVTENQGKKRFEVYELKGRKFACEQGPVAPDAKWQDVEAIPVGAFLRGTLRVLNLRPEELGGLLAAIGKEPASALKNRRRQGTTARPNPDSCGPVQPAKPRRRQDRSGRARVAPGVREEPESLRPR